MALRHPLVMAGRTIASSETVVVRLVTEARAPGWGEANVATLLTGETANDILDVLARLGEHLRGRDARDLRRLAEAMAGLAPAASSARAAVDMALHDVVARSLGISVSRLLGGSERLDAPIIALIDFASPDWIGDCRRWLAQGAQLIKVKVANASVEEELRCVRVLAAEVAGRALLAADANAGWSAEQAESFCAGLAGTPMLFLEQPLPPGQASQAAALAAACDVPWGADEAIRGPADIVRCATDETARGVSLKLIKAGGVTPLRDAAALAAGLGLAVNLSGKVGETSIANASTLHVASAVASPRWGVSLTAPYLEEDAVAEPLPLAGSGAVLAGPGLGIAVEERRLADLAIARPDPERAEPGRFARASNTAEMMN